MKFLDKNPAAGICVCIFFMMASCFFVYFGIQVLLFAFSLEEPIPFILTFFSSNFIIMISLALLVGFSFRIAHIHKMNKTGVEKENPGRNGN
jgi:hypothetical protein